MAARTGRDAWGRRLGYVPAEMNAVIVEAGERGVTAADVASATGATESFVRAHFWSLLQEKRVVRLERGRYAVNPKRPANADNWINAASGTAKSDGKAARPVPSIAAAEPAGRTTTRLMLLHWNITPEHVAAIAQLNADVGNHPFVLRRIDRNVRRTQQLNLGAPELWRVLLGCLLTTQQRSGAGTPVNRLLEGRSFRLSLEDCRAARSCEKFVFRELTRFGGIRFTSKIAAQAATNLDWLEAEGWIALKEVIRDLKCSPGRAAERAAARFLKERLHGLGPKQSRNFLQWLGLSQYEVPVDSRVVAWLNEIGCPIHLSPKVLSNATHYETVLDGLQKLCSAAGVLPCVLDAMIFARNEPRTWDGG